MAGLIEDLKNLEKHDKLIAVSVVLLLIGAWSMLRDLQALEARAFVRSELIDLAILLLMADIIIHLGKIERKLYKEEKKIEREIKKAVKRRR